MAYKLQSDFVRVSLNITIFSKRYIFPIKWTLATNFGFKTAKGMNKISKDKNVVYYNKIF